MSQSKYGAVVDAEPLETSGPTPWQKLASRTYQHRVESGRISATWVAERLPAYDSLLELLGSSSMPAIKSVVSTRNPMSHSRLVSFLREDFNLFRRRVGLHGRCRVAVIMPNGPELSTALLATITHCTCVPINPAATADEITGELFNAGVEALLAQYGEHSALVSTIAKELGIPLIELFPNRTESASFSLIDPFSFEEVQTKAELESTPAKLTRPEDIALVLHTSGTTGNKKLVPILLRDLVLGALCITASCNLLASDVCCNTMPLYHVGGICRNLLSP
ncbi:hypothetical protein CYMTET_11307, partial [Cymbomonas tetramitiformis]